MQSSSILEHHSETQPLIDDYEELTIVSTKEAGYKPENWDELKEYMEK